MGNLVAAFFGGYVPADKIEGLPGLFTTMTIFGRNSSDFVAISQTDQHYAQKKASRRMPKFKWP